MTWLADLNLLYLTWLFGHLTPKAGFVANALKRKGRQLGHRPDGVFIAGAGPDD
ncbi:hypothetical protein O9Z70_06740 [Devosia sp. YIM 151766]|uniref:hypothetical protein n=1 Tax=Devosia sp. YIM 151766 TaxID=3017325 RepID=UPI00255C7D43|nr:hypothetical protein [Devosia sp. YIM 151766]WIY54213.1 hypothetical protein O9Z70_06740 [Devosia sp. YIM 151766]